MRALALTVCLTACSEPALDAGAPPPPATPPASEPLPRAPAPLVDGSFDDWDAADELARDAAGDASGGFDVTALAGKTRGGRLYLRVDLAAELNLYNGPSGDGTLLLELAVPDGRRLTIDFRARSARLDDGASVPWWALDLTVAPSHAASAFELGIDLSAFGAAPRAPAVELAIAGSDALAAPVSVPFDHLAIAPEILSDARAPEAELRVASLNTELGGLFDPARAAPIARLLRAAAADVYCLQELGEASAGHIAARLEAADPHGDDAAWNVHVVNDGSIVGNAVASRASLVPIALDAERVAAAVVLVTPPVAVVSVHLKCCGYQGSGEDHTRRSQIDALAQGLARFRGGALGPELALYRDAPIVVTGDFNDVGSSGLTAGLSSARTDVALQRLALRQLARDDVFTWSEYDTTFPPATLDLLLYRDLVPAGGFVFDTSSLDPARLEELGVERGDSEASDHFMLVADFTAR
jgi:endonuclease/exonuclease/phosphatase family metal-dependent hydrolase